MATVSPPVITTETVPVVTTGIAPIIIDLGREKKRRIKDLKRGRGRLMAEVAAVMNEVRMNLGEDAADRELVPVIIIYKKKRRGRDGGGLRLFPFLS